MDMERVTQPLGGWFGFIRTNFAGLFKKLIRVNIYAMAAVLLAIVSVVAGVAALLFTGKGVLGWVLLAIGILVAIIMVVIARLFRLASYKVVDEEHGAKQKVDIIGVAKQKAVPAIIYSVIVFASYAIVIIPFGLAGFGLTALTAINVVSPFIQFGAWLVSIVLGFFLQFAMFKLVLADKGAVESIKASLGLVKRNFWETVVFYIILAVLGGFVLLPFMILLVIATFAAMIIFLVGGVTAAVVGGAQVLLLVGIALALLFIIPFSLVLNATNDTVLLPLSYRYWRTIRGDISLEKRPAMQQKPAAPPGAGAPAKTAATRVSGTQHSEGRAIMATPESSQVMIAPAAGAMAVVASQAKPEAKPAKKAPPKKPAPKRATNKKSS